MATKRKVSNLFRILRDKDYRDDIPTLHNKSPSGDLKTPILTPVMVQKLFSDIVGTTEVKREDSRKLYDIIDVDISDSMSCWTGAGTVGQEFDIETNLHESTTNHYAVFDVEENELYFIKIKGGTNPRPLAILDADNVLIYKTAVGSDYEYRLFTIPAGGVKAIINQSTAEEPIIIKIYKKE